MYKSEQTTVESVGTPVVVDRDSSSNWVGAALVLALVVFAAAAVFFMNTDTKSSINSAVTEQRQADLDAQQRQLNESAARQSTAPPTQIIPIQTEPGPPGPAGAPGPQGPPGEPAPATEAPPQ